MYIILIISLCASVICQDADEIQHEGDRCLDNEGFIGNCTMVQDCKQALLDLKWKRQPKFCKSKNSEVLVCCNLDSFKSLGRLENLDDCKFQYGKRCEKTQRKSHDACVQFQEMVCPKPEEFVSSPLSEIGEDSEEGQFPYMALLGFGDNSSTASWQCGGSIISNKYILTAAHCTGGPSVGPVTFAVVGTQHRSDPTKERRLFKIKTIIKHPEYRPPHKYNDIALLEMEAPITFDDLVRPACLYGELEQEDEVAYVAVWGATNKAEAADVLQNAKIYKFKDEECAKLYQPTRLLKQGLNSTTQLCYGHHRRPTAICRGDSGGPLETFNYHFPCLRTVVGVTSFGKSCGHTGEPGIYTRVSAFLPWIESVLWP